jgi:hypothetical protein
MTGNFNPLTDSVKSASKSRESFDLAPDPTPLPVLDTTTPAVAKKEPRRFTLGDLPRYADALYPKLKEIFPHINDRMYGGWIRGCINDNSCFFVCIDAEQNEGAAGMAFIGHDPLSPVPFIDVLFVIGLESVRIDMYKKIVKWAGEVGAKEIRNRLEDKAFIKLGKSEALATIGKFEERITPVIVLE